MQSGGKERKGLGNFMPASLAFHNRHPPLSLLLTKDEESVLLSVNSTQTESKTRSFTTEQFFPL